MPARQMPARRLPARPSVWAPALVRGLVVVLSAALLAVPGGSGIAATQAAGATHAVTATQAAAGGQAVAATQAAGGSHAVAATQAAGATHAVVAVQAAAGGQAAVAVQAAGGTRALAGPRVVAKAAILADEATGQVLFQRNAGAARAMASTTKVMTALLALERLDQRRVVVIGAGPPRVGEESLRLRRGERLTVRQLLLGLLVKSANDAGVALAEAVDGSEAAFVRRMNRRAAVLGLTATHYVTPYGLDRPGHRTSARDLAHLWEVAMRRPDFRSLVATRAGRIPGSPLSLRRFVTTNQLLGSYRWTVGGKTGFTNRAGRCLVASASRGGRRLVAVALGSPNAFADVHALFEYGFSSYVRARLAARGQPVSPAAGRPASYQAAADVDALIPLDQLDQVRLILAPGQAAGPAAGDPGGTGGGTSGGTGAGAGATSGGTGTAAGDPGPATTGWFTIGARRLVPVRLAPLPAGGPAPTITTAPAAPTTGSTPASTASGGTVSNSGAGVTLTLGAAVHPWGVPPGAAAPVINPSLRRAPP